ncbi:hypothetical protein Sinac_6437 [Singulisphaera acidiphila DSM 18658]|uniref:Uncharacterized protein n=1 Tax=Singulisphaera acidiphila (strain ATCC BAA-1392 / DSM 18658 / VKM B-2454 / MOB10) TaxID=886293 RepID=L0DMN6_SINAD|nr:hypothetical protein Sinac_6437 [Singulisphaera acidiphila DSM 18658]
MGFHSAEAVAFVLAVGRSHDMPEESFGLVVDRKNDYGSVSLAGLLFSLFQMWGVSLCLWLMAYLKACAVAGGCEAGEVERSCRGTAARNNAVAGTAE